MSVQAKKKNKKIPNEVSKATCSELHDNMAVIWDRVVEDKETIVLSRRGKEGIVMMNQADWAGIMETMHLLKSKANAQRLLSALEASKKRKKKPQSLEEVAQLVGYKGKV